MIPKLSLTDEIFLCMRDGNYWTFWGLQKFIKDKTGVFYGEPTISAKIRDLRKDRFRGKYGLPMVGETVFRRRRYQGKGYEYRLITQKRINE